MRVLLVTGAGRGIGAAVSRQGAEQGYVVAAVDKHPIDYASPERSFCGAGEIVGFQADLTEAHAVRQIFQEVEKKLGRIDCLVNNAGGGGTPTEIAEWTDDQVKSIISLNLLSTIYCSRQAIRSMAKQTQDGRSIVNISSRAAELGDNPGLSLYAATKGSVNSFTIALAKEVAKFGIRVNAVAPGIIHTEGHDTTSDLSASRISQTVPMQRAGKPEEVADAVLFLLSRQASYITGEVINVSGGR